MLADCDLSKRSNPPSSCSIVKDIGLCSAATRADTEALYLGVPQRAFRCPCETERPSTVRFVIFASIVRLDPGYHLGITAHRIRGRNVGLSACQFYGAAKDFVLPESGGGWRSRILIPPSFKSNCEPRRRPTPWMKPLFTVPFVLHWPFRNSVPKRPSHSRFRLIPPRRPTPERSLVRKQLSDDGSPSCGPADHSYSRDCLLRSPCPCCAASPKSSSW
jgi:hypothetical protein